MLGFFRKYQKFFFVIVTFFIVISFVFFGTSSTLMNREEVPNREIGYLIDGSVLRERELSGMIDLLQYGMEEGGHSVNFLNDSMVHRDILQSGIGQILAEHYFDALEEDFAERWKRAKSYVPYVHPYAPSISAENTWNRFAPEINMLLDQVRQAPEGFSKEQLPLLFKLYSAQSSFPPYLMHQMLFYQQKENEGIRPDPGLPQANVALFGFQSIEDWFGNKFQEITARFILNAACIAQEEGYSVDREEAQIALFSNVYRGLKTYAQGKNPGTEEVQNYYFGKIRSLGLSEKEAMDLWRKVMLVKAHFDEVGDAVFLDGLALNQFKSFAKASHKICRYQLPHSLQLRNFRDLLKFQRYLEAVAQEDVLGLPTKLHSSEIVKEEHPELVFKAFEVEMASINKSDVAARIPLRKTWQWEGKEENFAILQQKFPQLKDANSASEKERFHSLESLDDTIRFKVDQFAREALIEENPQLIDAMLCETPLVKQTLKVRIHEKEGLFSGRGFLTLLENEGNEISRYSIDEEVFHRIHILQKADEWEILSFADAKQDETLDKMLDDLLREAHLSLEIEEPFETSKDHVGMRIYADLLKSIEDSVGAKIENLEEYAAHRFDRYLQMMQEKIKGGAEIVGEGPFALIQTEEEIPGKADAIVVGEFSQIKEGGFYKLLEEKNVEVTEEEIARVKQPLKRDAEKKLMHNILERFEKDKVIIIHARDA